MNTRSYIFTFMLLMVSLQLAAQTSILDQYIQEGLKSNLQLQQEQLNYEKSEQSLQLARALFMPQVSANASYQLAGGGRKISFPVGDLLNGVYSTLNQLTGTTNFPQIQNVNEQFLANNFHDTKLRVIQPLFNPDIYFAYKAQKELTTVQKAQKKTYENELKYNIASAYFQYLQTEEGLLILKKTKVLLNELLKINQSLVANAKATKDVVLNAEYELSKVEQQLAETEKNNQVARSYFNFLLNRDLNHEITRDTTMMVTYSNQQTIDQLTTQAIQQRQEIKQLEGGIRANQQLVGLQKGSAFMPKLNAVGDVGYQGFQYKFDNSQQYWLVQFGLTWDIFKGGEKQVKIQQAKIDQQVMTNRMDQLKKQIELQVIQAHYELEMANKTLEASQSGVRSTERSFQIIQSKYREGQAILLEYLDAQNKLTTARLTQSINHYELLRKEAALQKTIATL
ncbi:MAG: TolC family protein [Bacteroidetes bacterium]|nr:TolC family protein [Bacteroidota bacterium]